MVVHVGNRSNGYRRDGCTADRQPGKQYFKATAIIDLNLLDDELTREIDVPEQNEHFEVIVLGIPNLKQFYETVFERCVTECSL